ncbi:hypothetical protein [Parapedobacter defluvii]
MQTLQLQLPGKPFDRLIFGRRNRLIQLPFNERNHIGVARLRFKIFQ